MGNDSIRFDNAAAYERYMGVWSQLAGAVFLEWLDPKPQQRWLDIGCGSGAFTEMIVSRCAPAAVDGLDPAEEQLVYARSRRGLGDVRFRQGDAMALPYPANTFDVAVMPLVIFFVPDAARGVAEMGRVVRPGGMVAAYAWDMAGGGFPYAVLLEALRGLGIEVPGPPSIEASRLGAMRKLWGDAGLAEIETREIAVRRTFADFDDFWTTALDAPSVGPGLAAMPAAETALLKSRVRSGLSTNAAGTITCEARANAVKGRVPDRARMD